MPHLSCNNYGMCVHHGIPTTSQALYFTVASPTLSVASIIAPKPPNWDPLSCTFSKSLAFVNPVALQKNLDPQSSNSSRPSGFPLSVAFLNPVALQKDRAPCPSLRPHFSSFTPGRTHLRARTSRHPDTCFPLENVNDYFSLNS